ncbi:BQ5605_C001g00154 [Microbotryum silenes-dioicae]|uniref:BQ5605_C001g00154 protein n=1 Tax=Microbotryum silenes-dioicae TaxID=796604 RepID=A0A2X0MWX7_9BASI|nr:BQ5605_C001g00154 [Microbotryum silenes-dioicae]
MGILSCLCQVWNMTFQLILDALARRGIALDLKKVWPGEPRASQKGQRWEG